jgi:predicted DNA-binding protein
MTNKGRHQFKLSLIGKDTMSTLSSETQRRIDLLFAAEERELAARLLMEHCGFRFSEEPGELEERIRFAALKLSDGKIDQLRQAIDWTINDWRDLLMAAGFGHDTTAHKKWIPKKWNSEVEEQE